MAKNYESAVKALTSTNEQLYYEVDRLAEAKKHLTRELERVDKTLASHQQEIHDNRDAIGALWKASEQDDEIKPRRADSDSGQ